MAERAVYCNDPTSIAFIWTTENLSHDRKRLESAYSGCQAFLDGPSRSFNDKEGDKILPLSASVLRDTFLECHEFPLTNPLCDICDIGYNTFSISGALPFVRCRSESYSLNGWTDLRRALCNRSCQSRHWPCRLCGDRAHLDSLHRMPCLLVY